MPDVDSDKEAMRINGLTRDILHTAVQMGSEVLLLEPQREGYLAFLQKGRGMEMKEFPQLKNGDSVAIMKALESLIDSRRTQLPIVKQGRVTMTLAKKDMVLDITCTPRIIRREGEKYSTTVTIFFHQQQSGES